MRTRYLLLLQEQVSQLAVSKVAGRERDIDYARQAKAHGLADPAVLSERVEDLPVSDDVQARVSSLIATL
jgi:hypothetical protein